MLKRHLPYHESDHVLNIAYNALSGGTCLEDIELRRNGEVHLDALGAERIPDPTTEEDFCRRFTEDDVESLMKSINDTRLKVWADNPRRFSPKRLWTPTAHWPRPRGNAKKGMDVSYNGTWGVSPAGDFAGENGRAAVLGEPEWQPALA